MDAVDNEDIPICARPAGCVVPLIPWQLHTWNLVAKHERPLSVRLCAASTRIIGALDTSRLRDSVELIIDRHESLRTRITIVDGRPRQSVEPRRTQTLEVIDLAPLPPTAAAIEAKTFSQQFAGEKIDLCAGPLFASRLIRLSPREHLLILSLDHMVADAISCRILRSEIWEAYRQIPRGLPLSLPELPIQFADYCVWQTHAHEAWLKKHESYWRDRLAGVSRVQFCDSNLIRGHKVAASAMRHVPFGMALSSKLRDLAHREGTLLPLFALAVLAPPLSRECNQRDLIVCFSSHGRYNKPELRSMIGLLARGLFLRIEIRGGNSFYDLLQAVHCEFKSASLHDGVEVAPGLVPEANMDIVFNWNWLPGKVERTLDQDGSVKLHPFQIPSEDERSTGDEEPPIKFLAAFSDTPAGLIMSLQSRFYTSAELDAFGNSVRTFAELVTQQPLELIYATNG